MCSSRHYRETVGTRSSTRARTGRVGVAASAAHLVRAKRYLYTSSISVYDIRHPEIGDGICPFEQMPPNASEGDMSAYGPFKRRSEDVVRAVFGAERALIVRPGLIVGPYDPTDRFTYWVERGAAGGEMLAPGSPSDRVQFIDVRDLARLHGPAPRRRA